MMLGSVFLDVAVIRHEQFCAVMYVSLRSNKDLMSLVLSASKL